LVFQDTEFPGIVARLIGNFKNSSDYQYQLLRCNVDMLQIIQLGLTFYDELGFPAPDCPTYQFNFRFSLESCMYAKDSIDMLEKSGIQFDRHKVDGINPDEFASLLITSGVVLRDEVVWISFHSGYDFGYLMKVLTCQPLPQGLAEFFETLKIYFPVIYDVKVR
jgi:CCR4-NOT transcription complex subunit 7/8